MDYPTEVIAAYGSGDGDLESHRDVKQLLLRHIDENPGIWYRELLRLTGISNGALSHHLRGLEESGRIRVQRTDSLGKTRYYNLDVTDSQSNIIGFMRNDTAKQIVLMMLDNDFCTFSEIVEKTGKSQSTVSWHMKRLVAGKIVKVLSADYVLYSLADKAAVSDVLSKYKRSLLEVVANNYAEIIDEL